MLHSLIHLFISLVEFDHFISSDHIIQYVVRLILLIFEPFHLSQLLLLIHSIRQIINMLRPMHLELGLCDLLRPVKNPENLRISISNPSMVICKILVSFVCHGFLFCLLTIKLLLFSYLVGLAFCSVIFHLVHQLIIKQRPLILILVVLKHIRDAEYLIIVPIF